jgi:hypothetical protein
MIVTGLSPGGVISAVPTSREFVSAPEGPGTDLEWWGEKSVRQDAALDFSLT